MSILDVGPGVLGWRDWRFTYWASNRAYTLGIVSGCCHSGTGHGWRVSGLFFHGQRPYILGIEREDWAKPWHLLRYHHWPANWILLGICGKCAPWPCCGATGFDHVEGCEEDPWT